MSTKSFSNFRRSHKKRVNGKQRRRRNGTSKPDQRADRSRSKSNFDGKRGSKPERVTYTRELKQLELCFTSLPLTEEFVSGANHQRRGYQVFADRGSASTPRYCFKDKALRGISDGSPHFTRCVADVSADFCAGMTAFMEAKGISIRESILNMKALYYACLKLDKLGNLDVEDFESVLKLRQPDQSSPGYVGSAHGYDFFRSLDGVGCKKFDRRGGLTSYDICYDFERYIVYSNGDEKFISDDSLVDKFEVILRKNRVYHSPKMWPGDHFIVYMDSKLPVSRTENGATFVEHWKPAQFEMLSALVLKLRNCVFVASSRGSMVLSQRVMSRRMSSFPFDEVVDSKDLFEGMGERQKTFYERVLLAHSLLEQGFVPEALVSWMSEHRRSLTVSDDRVRFFPNITGLVNCVYFCHALCNNVYCANGKQTEFYGYLSDAAKVRYDDMILNNEDLLEKEPDTDLGYSSGEEIPEVEPSKNDSKHLKNNPLIVLEDKKEDEISNKVISENKVSNDCIIERDGLADVIPRGHDVVEDKSTPDIANFAPQGASIRQHIEQLDAMGRFFAERHDYKACGHIYALLSHLSDEY